MADIFAALIKEDLNCDGFFSGSRDDDMNLNVICQIHFVYGRTRGKYFAQKMNAQFVAKHHEILCSALETPVVIVEQKENEGTNNYVKCPKYKFLIKQHNSKLISICMVRKLRYLGAKQNWLSWTQYQYHVDSFCRDYW